MNVHDDIVGAPIIIGNGAPELDAGPGDAVYLALFLRIAETLGRACELNRPLVLARVEEDAFILTLIGHPTEDQEWGFRIPEDEPVDARQKHMIYMIQACCEHYDADTDPILCQIMCGYGGTHEDIIDLLEGPRV